MKIFKCLRCYHEWASKQEQPTICPRCKSPYWRKPRKGTASYVKVMMTDHPRADSKGTVHRAILVMEEHIGRFLLRGEEVHHINGIVIDDRIENLELLTRKEHQQKYNNLDTYNHRPRNTKGRPFYGNQYVKVAGWKS